MTSLYDCLLDSMAQSQSLDDKAIFFFVGDVNAHQSEWQESVSHTDQYGRDALNFCNLSGCELLVLCFTHISGDRLDLVMTDVPDIVLDVFVGTPLGTSDHCFVSCVHQIEQSVQEYNIRSTALLKHCTNWDNIRCAVRSFSLSTILKSADPLDVLD